MNGEKPAIPVRVRSEDRIRGQLEATQARIARHGQAVNAFAVLLERALAAADAINACVTAKQDPEPPAGVAYVEEPVRPDGHPDPRQHRVAA
jgi:hypothetical protein